MRVLRRHYNRDSDNQQRYFRRLLLSAMVQTNQPGSIPPSSVLRQRRVVPLRVESTSGQMGLGGQKEPRTDPGPSRDVPVRRRR